MSKASPQMSDVHLPKCPSGIAGLDEITEGGLPRGRPTLVCGNTGCGKTLFALEFLIRGATEYGQPGVFLAFEETTEDLIRNSASLGFDLRKLIEQKKISVQYVHMDRSEIHETGEYDLEALFIRLDHAIKSIGAKRVVLDTLEVLLGALSDKAVLRSEIQRLFRWLKDKGVTAVITAERGEKTFTRDGLEEYISDCVISLEHHIDNQVLTRRLRIVKYRGSTHGTNEYPFLIDRHGISVLPITSLGLDNKASKGRVSTGIKRLNAMLDGGYYRGSSILLTGTAGTGKTTLAGYFANATCQAGQRCLFFSFEESQDQLIRNMRSIGLNLEPWVKKGLLQFHSSRPTLQGLELHLLRAHQYVDEFKPSAVIFDPISNLTMAGQARDVQAMLMRLADFLKNRQITAIYTALTEDGGQSEAAEVGTSSIVDTWLLLRDFETNGERNRGLFIIKSRGMAHSNQIREFVFTNKGVELLDVPRGPNGFLMGSARLSYVASEKDRNALQMFEATQLQLESTHTSKALAAQIAALQAQLNNEVARSAAHAKSDQGRLHLFDESQTTMSDHRQRERVPPPNTNKAREALL